MQRRFLFDLKPASVRYGIVLTLSTMLITVSRFLRFRRVSNWQSPIHKHKSYFQTLKDQHLPPVPGIDTEIRQGATTQRAIAPAVNSRDLFPYLADWSIRFHVATLNLERAVDMVVDLAKFHVVPNSRTINIILSEMLRQLRDDLKEQPSNLPPLPKVSTASCSLPNRTYHTFPNSPSDITRLPICFKSISTPWVKRIISWEEFSMHQVVNNHSASLLNKLLPYLNQNNIHSSTIRLLAKLSTYASQLEMPWEIAARAKHPKTVLQKAQEQLVAAACEESISSPETRHIQLSKVFLPIMKLEGMSIIPSRESLLITLHACVKDGNIIGARALVNRLTGYGYTLDQREVAELVKCLPTRGIGTLSTPTGEILSSMEMRTEQLAFILELRPFISDPAYLGSYVLALGRCGSAVQIWETWESVRDEKLKDGTVTTFVEGFIQARDLLSAIEFARIVYHLGYPLNYQRAQAIAGGIVRGQRRIGIELINEMVRQNCDLDQKEMEQIISSMLTSQGFALELLNSSQLRLISDSSGELVEIIKARMEGEDIHCALGEIDLALEILDQ